ncbi:MAG: AMP-binding protein [Pseudomonadota bacterium]
MTKTEGHSIGSKFLNHVLVDPERPFLHTSNGIAYSRSDIHAAALDFLAVLRDAGARPNDRVSVIVRKSPSAFVLFLACQYGGLTYHPVNPDYSDPELLYLLKDAEPMIVVCDRSHVDIVKSAGLDLSGILTLNADGEGDFPLLDISTGKDHDQQPLYRDIYRVDEQDISVLLYTSGTTGRPKGAMLTYGNLSAGVASLTKAWEISEDDRLLHFLPFFHVHGLIVAAATLATSGAEIYFEPKFDIDRVFSLLPRVSLVMGVPTHYGRLHRDDRLNSVITNSVRLFISGSAPLDAETSDAFEQRTGKRILERYGMSEALMLSSNPLNGRRKAGTVGFPLPGVNVRIRHSDQKATEWVENKTRNSDKGIVEVRGENIFCGYRNQQEKTREAFTKDNWFITGDIGLFDDDGYLCLVGRQSDMIITGGLNVYPREVENVLISQKGVTEVAVFGVPHPDFGEGVVAAIVVETDETSERDLIRNCEAELSKYKIPKVIEFVDQLPKNAMGKIDRKQLKSKYAELFAQ